MLPSSSGHHSATRAIDPLPLRLIKRAVLILFGPLYFLFVAFVPLICAQRKGFRGWYWRLVKRSCSRLLWLLSIRAEMRPEEKAALAADTDSIIVVNHRSHLDGFTLMHVVPDAKWFTFAAKSEFWNSRLLRTGFDGAGLVPINRESGSLAMQTLTNAVKGMAARRSVVLFPEGTRAKTRSLGEFKAGAILVARETGRTITPIIIHDSDQLLPRGKYLPRSGKIRVQALPTFVCDLTVSVDQDLARLRALMMAAFEQ
ncbi:lysophospholipid acyltransferase family protein [Roseovarius rhodophyticola]|uniref:Lysophospholipid acyltransferase family protein n=1 Tax=Roseovarius rhodophyticola TaxID=3080827 RepID=A0ABZ2TAM1_9RHOB|nr:lysophospholipid acyltransferase family protein [Roseovarius sp. W115]MDV2930448.1 lysophospholipid acyltransferase family protein [Roseovarius sp. W115]